MSSKTTWRLFFLAVGLFAFIYFIERRAPESSARAKPRVFARTLPTAVTALEVHTSNQVIRVERTNDSWRLVTPPYPAQSTPIETFINSLVGLERQAVISPSEVAAEPSKLKAFGLDPPIAKISLMVGSNRSHLHLGSRVALSEQIYAQMAGSVEVLVTDSAILKSIPTSVDQWRSPMLVHLGGQPFDHLQIRSGASQRLMEFERDPTNKIWRISKPTPARANHELILRLLQRLATTQVKQFVTDSPAADLERYGLQTPELELTYLLDTNRITSFEFGSSPTNDPATVYVRRLANTNIVTVPRDIFEELSKGPKDFHDPRLISIDLSQLTQVRINGTNGYAVTKMTNGLWQVSEPALMAADPELMKMFLTNIQNMEIVEFAKDVPTDADLKQFGLAPARFTMELYSMRTNAAGALTNTLLTQVDAGSEKEPGAVYARRSDETPVYVTPAVADFTLPTQAWRLRDRHVFNFTPMDVQSITYSAGGKTNRLDRKATGFRGEELADAAIEEALFRVGRMQARNWSSKGSAKLTPNGITNESLAIEFGLVRDGLATPLTVRFGKPGIRNVIYASTILPGDTEPTVFEFPGEIFDLLSQALFAAR